MNTNTQEFKISIYRDDIFVTKGRIVDQQLIDCDGQLPEEVYNALETDIITSDYMSGGIMWEGVGYSWSLSIPAQAWVRG